MLPILCGIACAVLVILDVSGKLHPERTRSQVLLHLFSLSGALLPLMLAMLSPAAFLDDAAAMNPVFVFFARCRLRCSGCLAWGCCCAP